MKTEEQMAKDIVDTANELNKMIQETAEAKLRVEIDIDRFHTMTDRFEVPLVRATICKCLA